MTFQSVRQMAMVSLVASFLFACSGESGNQAAAPQGMPAPQVEVAKVISQRITEWDAFTGRLESPQTVSLRPRVSGYIDMVAFEEGSEVEQGQTLFLIDNRPYKEEVNRLEAQLTQVESQLSLAKTDFQRVLELSKTRAVSQEEVDNRRSAVQQAQAAVQATRASLALAKLNRGYTRVEAPISGRVSRALITAGNYVSAGETVLTTIVSTDKLYAYFDVDENSYLHYKDLEKSGQMDSDDEHPVAMKLVNDSDYDFWGQLDFVDNQINPTTGTIRVRAVFDNTDGYLVPGMFAQLKVASSPTYEGILIDEKAIGTDLNNKYVYVIDDNNTVAYRPVKIGDKIGNMRLINGGLEAGDTILINGLQRVRPGVTVDPQIIEMASKDQLANIEAWQARLDANSKIAQLPSQQSSVTEL